MKLRFEQFVAVARPALFAFHSDPANLAVLLRGYRNFELLSHEGHIRPPARVRTRQSVWGLRHELVFEQFLLEPPLRFGERQVEGPFARFEHVHEFAEARGGTTIVDLVDFALPWYLGGPLVEPLVAATELESFFAFRRAAYQRLVATKALQ